MKKISSKKLLREASIEASREALKEFLVNEYKRNNPFFYEFLVSENEGIATGNLLREIEQKKIYIEKDLQLQRAQRDYLSSLKQKKELEREQEKYLVALLKVYEKYGIIDDELKYKIISILAKTKLWENLDQDSQSFDQAKMLIIKKQTKHVIGKILKETDKSKYRILMSKIFFYHNLFRPPKLPWNCNSGQKDEITEAFTQRSDLFQKKFKEYLDIKNQFESELKKLKSDQILAIRRTNSFGKILIEFMQTKLINPNLEVKKFIEVKFKTNTLPNSKVDLTRYSQLKSIRQNLRPS